MVSAVEAGQEAQDAFMSDARRRRVDRGGRGEYGGLQAEDPAGVLARVDEGDPTQLTHELAR